MPWSAFWDRNYFAEAVPMVRTIMTNNFLRGAVTGLGLLNVWAALAHLADLLRGSGGSGS